MDIKQLKRWLGRPAAAGISPRARHVGLLLAARYDGPRSCFPLQETVTGRLGRDRYDVTRGVRELIKAGLLVTSCDSARR